MKTIGLAVLILFTAFASQAQLLTSYDFNGASTLPVVPATVAAGITASGITKGPNILNVVPNNNLLSVSPGNSANTPTNAVTLGQYFEFTVTPDAGGKLNLGALLFLVRRETADALGWVVRSSVITLPPISARPTSPPFPRPSPPWACPCRPPSFPG